MTILWLQYLTICSNENLPNAYKLCQSGFKNFAPNQINLNYIANVFEIFDKVVEFHQILLHWWWWSHKEARARLKLPDSVTWLGYFWKVLEIHPLTKLAQILGNFFCYFKTHSFYVKNCFGPFLGDFGGNWATFILASVHTADKASRLIRGSFPIGT